MATTLNAITSAGGGFAVTGDSSGILSFQSAGTTYMTMNTSGYLGIGTTSPQKNLVVSNAGAEGLEFIPAVLSNESRIQAYNRSTSAWNKFSINSGTFEFFTNGGTSTIYGDSSGNVGIGNSSPVYKVDAQTAALGNTAGNQQYIYRGLTNTGNSDAFEVLYNRKTSTSGWNNADLLIRRNVDSTATQSTLHLGVDVGGGTFQFDTAGSERMRIDSSGNVLVGKTTTSTTTAGVQLIPNGTAAFTFDTTGDGPLTQFIDPNASTPNGFRFLSFRWGASPTEIGTITKSSASAVAYNTTSDYRLKENVMPMTGALEKVALLKPVTYTWKADGSDGQGFIAHELQAVVPDCVTGEKDAVDEEGNPQYQGIDTSFLVATLTAAIQEQQAIIEQLKADVEALKGASA